jgi:hypothetical protein
LQTAQAQQILARKAEGVARHHGSVDVNQVEEKESIPSSIRLAALGRGFVWRS